MLVLSRRLGDSVMIGDEVEIKVLELSRERVKIGITCPDDVKIFRKEIWLKIPEENLDAGEDSE